MDITVSMARKIVDTKDSLIVTQNNNAFVLLQSQVFQTNESVLVISDRQANED